MRMNHESLLDVALKLDRAGHFALDVSIQTPLAGVTVLMGASGSGKTTLLRSIAGLEKAACGHIQVGDVCWQSSTYFLPVHKRSLAYVFQEPSLFPHLTVKQNLEFALIRSVAKSSLDEQVHLIGLLGIEGLLERRPEQLSGGEKQRVAIARAIFRKPALLMMDEPLAALDTQRKQEVLPYIEALARETDIPILYVTHSIEEAARISDRVVYLQDGRVQTQGHINEVLERVNITAPEFGHLGSAVSGSVSELLEQWKLCRVTTTFGDVLIPDCNRLVGEPTKLFIQANQVSLSLSQPVDSTLLNNYVGHITKITSASESALATIQVNLKGVLILAQITQMSLHALQLETGLQVWVSIKSAALMS